MAHEALVEGAIKIIDGCTNVYQTKIAVNCASLICFSPEIGLTAEQEKKILDAIDKKLDQLEKQ